MLNALKSRFGADEAVVSAWFRHWVPETFAPPEEMLATRPDTGASCRGDRPGMADICLFAQVLNNRRFQVDMKPYPAINRIYDTCAGDAAFIRAAPENQPDAE